VLCYLFKPIQLMVSVLFPGWLSNRSSDGWISN
jgi:hypothetical protein